LMSQLAGKKIHKATEIPIYSFGRGFIEGVAALEQRRAEVSISVTERQLYLDIDGRSFATGIEEHRIG
jgi:hypothetical protein